MKGPRFFSVIGGFLLADTRLHHAVLVGRLVCRSVTFLNFERFLHYCSSPTIRDCLAVFPALFWSRATRLHPALSVRTSVRRSVGPSIRWFISLFVIWSVCPLVCSSVQPSHFTFFCFGLTAPAQMI